MFGPQGQTFPQVWLLLLHILFFSLILLFFPFGIVANPPGCPFGGISSCRIRFILLSLALLGQFHQNFHSSSMEPTLAIGENKPIGAGTRTINAIPLN